MSEFKEYIEHGWKLVPILPGHKSPRAKGWQRLENAITNPDHEMRSAGLAHAYSGTCAIDVDDYARAQEWLAERGVDLDALFAAPDSVQISSGRANHGKLIYSLPEPLCSKKVALFDKNKSALDFRCATAAGMTVQDVLPPSIHPDTTKPYKWDYVDEMFGDWRDLPLIPDALHQIWLSELQASHVGDEIPDKGASVEELRALLTYHDPSVNRDEWVQIGMAIHHECDGDLAGFELWDEWSQKSEKYAGRADLEASWRSFHDSPNSVTVGMLRQGVIATPEEFPDIESTDYTEDADPWAAAAEERRARFRLVPVHEIAQREPPEWLVDELLPKVDLAMIYGAPSTGKSFVALDLAFAVSHGFTWFNRKTKQGSVVWIAAEAAGAMRNRTRAYAQARGVRLENTELRVVEQTLSLMNAEDASALTDVLTEARPTLVVVDTLAAASGGANENSGEDMNVVLSNCRKIHEETGALVLLIHHSGKDASRGARGWSGLHAAVRAEFTVTHQAESPIRVLQVTKQNEGIGDQRLPFKLQVIPLEFDNNVTSCVIEHLDEAMIDPSAKGTLGGTQKMVFKAVYELSGGLGDEGAAVPIQDVYDAAIIQLPKPPEGKRDTRGQNVKRVLTQLHERGFITVIDDLIKIGASDDDQDISLPEM